MSAINVYITEKEEKKLNLKMIKEFDTRNLSELSRKLLNLYINNLVEITEEKEKNYRTERGSNKIRKNIVGIDDEIIQEIKNRKNKQNVFVKRNDLMKILYDMWLNDEIKI